MKGLSKFLILTGAIILLSAVLAPILYRFLPFLGAVLDRFFQDFLPFNLEKVLTFKFGRIFNRLIMIFTILAVLLFVRVRRDVLKDCGFGWRPDSLPMFLRAFLTGFLVLSGLCAVYMMTGYAAWRPASLGMGGWIVRFAGALATGLAVGFLEEFFFRGFCYRAVLGRLFGPVSGKASAQGAVWASIFLTSLFYSLVHFLSHKKPFIGPDPGFQDSIKLVLAPFVSIVHLEALWPQVLGLLFFGIILNWLVVRKNSLYPAVGLHAGCVFYIKLNGAFVDFLSNRTLILGSSKLYDGLTGWVVLVLMGFVLDRWMRGTRKDKLFQTL